MGADKNLISLKEAAKLSGYSSDYIGQLIRSGKIPGKQVYCNLAWMTTAEAVLEYKKNGKQKDKSGVKETLKIRQRKIAMEFNILKLFFQTFRSALPILVFFIVSLIALNGFFLYLILASPETPIESTPITNQEELVF